MTAALICATAAIMTAAADITSERFPDADAVTVEEIERVRYNPNGTYVLTNDCWTKILTEKGRRSESSVSFDYSKRYGTAAIAYVGIVGTNGVEREVDVSATMKESTDNGSMGANIYDPLDRHIACTVPGLRIGDILHVRLTKQVLKPRCEGKWADIAVMEWSRPIVRSVYEITAPAALPLRRIAVRHPLGNVVSNVTTLADGSTVHVFTATNSPQAFPEPDMPPLYTQVQNVRVSTAADWPEISRWYWDLCAPHLAKTNAAMIAKVRELVAGAGGEAAPEMDRLRAVFRFVSQEIRYMGLTMEDTSPGYAPHDVDITFDNRYGVCRDKAGLLVAMLRLAGFKAFPVLIHVGAKHDPEVPQPFFNHAIVAVEPSSPIPHPYILMDPTDESTKDLFPAYLCNNSYLVARPEGEKLAISPVPTPEANLLRAESTGTLSKDGAIFLENDIRFGGINDTIYRSTFLRLKPEDREKFFERAVKAIASGAELIRCEIEPKDLRDTEKPLRVRLASRLPETILRGETREELSAPFVSRTLGTANFLLRGNTSLEKRRFPLVLDTTARVDESLTLDLGEALGPVRELPPAEAGWDGGFRVTRRFAVTNGTLRASRSTTVSAVEFSPSAYADLREEIKRQEAADRRRPVFSNDPANGADVRWLLDSVETTVFSDSAWVTTNRVVKEVLTYAGKKSSAELKFSFNPQVERIGILSAVVSNRNGKVAAVSDHEMNVMDCGWAASAPRYPASRLLVVNLPSVEIGSVISYVTVRAVTNAPVAFYGTFNFDSLEPVERRVVRVNDWKREVVRPRRLPREPLQPSAALWRDQVIVSSNRFAAVDLRIGEAPKGAEALAGLEDADEIATIRQVRDWMAKYVKCAGPGLYELPLDLQLTDPGIVLKERYAAGLDYIRTMCALLREAGLGADVVFVANDADEPESVRRRIRLEKPNVRAFATPLCRVRWRTGGFLGLGGEDQEVFIGRENEYAEIGPSAYQGCDYFDPTSGEFGIVTVPRTDFAQREVERTTWDIRENGAVDLTVESLMYGPAVNAFRQKYAEILPEDRSRLYQSLLGSISQAAAATSDLEADITSYPARRRFTCLVPDYAVVQGDAMTIQVPPLLSSIPNCTGHARRTPFAIGASEEESEEMMIVFPEGYTRIECLPKPFVLANPLNPTEIWLEGKVTSEVKDNRAVIRLTRHVHRHADAWFAPSFYELFKDWRRIATSRASRTVTVTRP